jgi:hypothetical protein
MNESKHNILALVVGKANKQDDVALIVGSIILLWYLLHLANIPFAML